MAVHSAFRASLEENPSPTAAPLRSLAAWLFAVVLATDLLLFSGTVRSVDGGTMLAVTRGLVTQGSFAVPEGSIGRPGRDGRLYAQYGPGCSLAALPLFLAGHGLARVAGLSPKRAAQVEEFAVALFNPLVVAGLAVLVLLTALELGVGHRAAAAGGLVCAFGTGLFVQMKDFNSEPLTTLLLLAGFYLLLRQRREVTYGRFLLLGALAGAAVLTRPANVLGAVLLGLAVVALSLRQGRGVRVLADAACFALPLLACAGLYGLYNLARFGDPLDTGYHEVSFNYPLLRGLWLQLFSLERGLVWYDPVVLLVPVGAALLWRRQRGAVLLAGALAVTYVLLYATYAQSPAGGHSMGQRFLLVIVPLLVVLALPVLGKVRSWTRALVVAIIAVSVLVQLPLVWVNPSYYYAGLGAEQERSGDPTVRSGQTVLVRSWALAGEVTRDALTRPEWVRSLPARALPGAERGELLPGPRSYHVPYCWWALAWAYGVPGLMVLVAVVVNVGLALLCVRGLMRSWPNAKETPR